MMSPVRMLLVIGWALTLAACNSSSMGVGSSTTTGSTGDASMTALAASGNVTGDLRMVPNLPPPPNTGNGTDQLLSVGDTLDVDVFQVPDLRRTVQIDSSGSITLPLIGTVKAAGKTVQTLGSEVTARYGSNYLQNPQVTVLVKDSVGQRITVDGEVAKAGIYPVSANATLVDAIAVAGGFREIADPSKVYVFRDFNGQKLVANYNVSDIRSGRKPNPRIYGGDVVVVFTSQSKVALRNLKDVLGLARSVAPVY